MLKKRIKCAFMKFVRFASPKVKKIIIYCSRDWIVILDAIMFNYLILFLLPIRNLYLDLLQRLIDIMNRFCVNYQMDRIKVG